MTTFGQTIRQLRKAAGLTQRQLADEVGINFTYLSKIENDRLEQNQTPKKETIEKVATALGADADALLLAARKMPDSIRQRVIQRPDAFRKMAWLDDETLDELLAGLDQSGRRQAEVALRQANDFLQNVLDSLISHIAVLDERGTIIAVNDAWRFFANANGLNDESCNVGADYVAVCDAAVGLGSENARVVADAVRSVLANSRSSFELEYPCHSPEEERWFMVSVTRFEECGRPRAVVAHDDITARKVAEIELSQKTQT